MSFPATHPALARALAARDYATPTAVQTAVLEGNNTGRDLVVSAQTGSGKTVAFGLAMAATILGEAEQFPRAGAPLALIIAPTRELALQVQRELAWLYGETGARIATCVGGMDARAEARALDQGTHIVVGTPGRLRDHLERRRLILSDLKTIVLDEADEMLDLGFREDLEFILDATPETRQTLLFSATMPREIEALAKRYQRDAVRIETLRRNEQHTDIEYQALRIVPGETENAVVNVLRFHEAPSAIVFCSTREAVKRMLGRLSERGFNAVALSGELTQNERTHALQALRDGRARVLVATDVAARGLDLPDLALVIHADLPNDHETLLHRSGRTGRAGKKGRAVLIVPFNRRRKAEILLNAARLKVEWATPPQAEEIRARDQERFLASALFTDPANEEEQTLVQRLIAARTPEEIALALVRKHREGLPAPEDLAEDRGPPPRTNRFERPTDGARPERTFERRPRVDRNDGRPMTWFRLNIGRERNADPRWLVPLICQAGNVTKAEIGAIKIFDRDTRFEIATEHADSFAEAATNMKPKEGKITRLDRDADRPRAEATDRAAPTETIDAPRVEKPRYDKEKPRFDKVRPRFDKDRPRFDKDRPRHDGDKPRSEGFEKPRYNSDRPRQDTDRPRPDSDRPRPHAARGTFERRDRAPAEAQGTAGDDRASPRPFDSRTPKAPWRDKPKGKGGPRGQFSKGPSKGPNREGKQSYRGNRPTEGTLRLDGAANRPFSKKKKSSTPERAD